MTLVFNRDLKFHYVIIVSIVECIFLPFSVLEMFDKIINLPNSQQDLIREEFARLNAALDNVCSFRLFNFN